MPIGSIRNGNHPSALVMAGNHANDYEGRVTLSRLAQSLEAGDISGHPVLLPMSNYPAIRVGCKTPLIDEGNLDPNFPGDPPWNINADNRTYDRGGVAAQSPPPC